MRDSDQEKTFALEKRSYSKYKIPCQPSSRVQAKERSDVPIIIPDFPNPGLL